MRRSAFMRSAFVAVALASCLLAVQACRSASESSPGQDTTGYGTPAERPLSDADRRFLIESTQGNLTEVEIGRLAEAKGTLTEVRSFGRRLIEDHASANAELRLLAERKGLELPTVPTDAQLREIERLRKLSGAEFDREFAHLMVLDHEKDVRTFEEVSRAAQDADVVAFAKKMLPVLREHLEIARDVAEKAAPPMTD